MLPVFFFRIITLGGEQRKGCKGGVHNPGSMTFLCRQQQQNQLQTTQRWFAGEQREKTAESFLTSSCSSLPWGYCCRRGEGSWWPLTRGGQGFKGQYYLTERLKPESVPQTRSPYQWESPTSPDTSYTPWAADPPGILPSLSAAASTVSRRCAWPALLAFPSASLCAQGGRARGSGTPTAAPPLPSHFMATRRKT